MGLGSFNSGGNATFLRIGMGVDDKGNPRAIIGRRAKAGDPGAVKVLFKDEPVMDADGNPIYRTEHAFVEGTITSIERTQPEFNGKKVDVLNLHINSGGQQFSLQLTKGDDYWLDFALRCDNADFGKSIKLQPYSIPQENNPKYSNRFLVIYQDGGKVEKKYKVKWMKETPEGYTPEPDQPPPYTYDADENAWRKGKTLRWLDEGPIQRAIDKVAFLNEQPEVEKRPIEDQQNVYGGVPAPTAADMPPMPNEPEDHLPF